MTNRDRFYNTIREMMKDDPLFKAVQSQTPEEVNALLEDIGVIENGKVSESYKKKFKNSLAPMRKSLPK